MKYENEIRTGKNVKQVVLRAMQFANSDPKGPVYLVGAREVMEEEVSPVKVDIEEWRPMSVCALAPWDVAALVDDLLKASLSACRHILLGPKTKCCYRTRSSMPALGIGVLESVPKCVNFPADDPLYQGNTWSEPRQNVALESGDLILILDSDVPWIPVLSRPSKTAKVYHIDVDPLKERRPLWYIPAQTGLPR